MQPASTSSSFTGRGSSCERGRRIGSAPALRSPGRKAVHSILEIRLAEGAAGQDRGNNVTPPVRPLTVYAESPHGGIRAACRSDGELGTVCCTETAGPPHRAPLSTIARDFLTQALAGIVML
jgi:hypothetical protein